MIVRSRLCGRLRIDRLSYSRQYRHDGLLLFSPALNPFVRHLQHCRDASGNSLQSVGRQAKMPLCDERKEIAEPGKKRHEDDRIDVLRLFMEAVRFVCAGHEVVRCKGSARWPRLNGIYHAFDVRKSALQIEIEFIIRSGQFSEHPSDGAGFDLGRPLRSFQFKTAYDILDEMSGPASCAGTGFLQLPKGIQESDKIDGRRSGYRFFGRPIGVKDYPRGGSHRGFDEAELLPNGEVVLLACRGPISDDLNERKQSECCAFDIGKVDRRGGSA